MDQKYSPVAASDAGAKLRHPLHYPSNGSNEESEDTTVGSGQSASFMHGGSRESWNSYQPHIKTYFQRRSEVLSLAESMDPRSQKTPSTFSQATETQGSGFAFGLGPSISLVEWEDGEEKDDWLHDPRE